MLDARTESEIGRFTAAVQATLGDELRCLALYGSAVDGDFVPGRSDVNTAVVVTRVRAPTLEALAPVVTRARRLGFALPLVVDPEYLARARDTFPIELSDIQRRHRLLAGTDLFAAITVERAALRTACEREARGKQLRLRALYLETSTRDDAFAAMLAASAKTFLVLLRQLLALRGQPPPPTYAAVLDPGEALLGPLPAMRRVFAHRTGERLPPAALRAEFPAYLDEVDRLVAAIDGLDG